MTEPQAPGVPDDTTTINVPDVPNGETPPADPPTEPATPPAKDDVRSNKPDPTPEPPKADNGEWKIEDLPAGAQKLIQGLRKEAGDNRVAAKTAEATAKDAAEKLEGFLAGFAKVMGLQGDDKPQTPPDPAKLTAELETAQTRQKEALVRIAVYEAAAEHGADPKRLTDSVSFINKVSKLDPGSEDFASRIGDAVRDAVSDNPFFRGSQALPPPPPPSGGMFAGGPGGRSPRAEDMSIDDMRKALVADRRPA